MLYIGIGCDYPGCPDRYFIRATPPQHAPVQLMILEEMAKKAGWTIVQKDTEGGGSPAKDIQVFCKHHTPKGKVIWT